MKRDQLHIVFICGSLEIGRNGVGDYCRRLAGELIRQGHKASLLALQERNLEEVEQGIQTDQDTNISVLRLPEYLKLEHTTKLAQTYIEKVNPSVLSLQYVPYSFHPKGLPFRWIRNFKRIGNGRTWQVMFHEIWIGISRISPFKHKIIGYFQKRLAQQLIAQLQPTQVAVTNKLYQAILEEATIHSSVITLFSNIPKSKLDEDLKEKLRLRLQAKNWKKYLVAGIFGTIYPEIDLQQGIQDLFGKAKKQDKKLLLLCFGRSGNGGTAQLIKLQTVFQDQMELLILGEQSPEAVSTLLQIADLGISCTPLQHLGKSGVYAAMKLHDLPIVFPTWTKLPEYETITQTTLKNYQAKRAREFSVAYIAQQYIDSLTKL